MAEAYNISDEPSPGKLSAYAVSPFLIFISYCIGGSWIALPWFVFNARAIGSVDAKKEVRLAIASPLSLVFALGAFAVLRLFGIEGSAAPHELTEALGLPSRGESYVFVALIAIKGAFVLAIQKSQEKSFRAHQDLRRKVRNGSAILVLGFLLRTYVVAFAMDKSVWLAAVILRSAESRG